MATNIGEKIKQLREEKNLSLNDLSATSGVDASQIEMIEKNELEPSMGTLIKLTRAMGIRLGTILDGAENQHPTLHHADAKTPTISTANANSEAREHLNFFALAKEKRDRHMEPFLINAKYCAAGCHKPSSHEGEEFLYILEGQVVLHYGSDTFKMTQGDSIYYDSIVPHLLSTETEGQTAKVLAVTYTPF